MALGVLTTGPPHPLKPIHGIWEEPHCQELSHRPCTAMVVASAGWGSKSIRVGGMLPTSVAPRVGSGESLESRLGCSGPQTF